MRVLNLEAKRLREAIDRDDVDVSALLVREFIVQVLIDEQGLSASARTLLCDALDEIEGIASVLGDFMDADESTMH
jgi:hypothetical protein